MSQNMSMTQARAQRLLDERVTTNRLHEDLLSAAEKRDDPSLSDVEAQQIDMYRERVAEIDKELENLNEVLRRELDSANWSKEIRSHIAGNAPGVSTENGNTVYRSFAVFARDKLITKYPQIATQAGGEQVKAAARERLMRAPEHTLTEDIAGLLPPQHIAQIMDVINKSRPIVASARRVNLERGSFTYPKITQRPTVELQSGEKTEGGTAEMKVGMETASAVTYIGGGNLSWQAINWSSPDALALWFDLAAESYAKRTETYAAGVLDGTAVTGTIAAPIGGTAGEPGTATFPQWLSGIVAGMAGVYDASDAMADTLYLSPDMFFLAAALSSDQGASLINAGGLNLGSMGGNVGGLRVVTSYGFGTATAIVGDSSAFLVAETAGSPVELRAVEPAIGGMEVGLIGAFAAELVDPTRFVKVA